MSYFYERKTYMLVLYRIIWVFASRLQLVIFIRLFYNFNLGILCQERDLTFLVVPSTFSPTFYTNNLSKKYLFFLLLKAFRTKLMADKSIVTIEHIWAIKWWPWKVKLCKLWYCKYNISHQITRFLNFIYLNFVVTLL